MRPNKFRIVYLVALFAMLIPCMAAAQPAAMTADMAAPAAPMTPPAMAAPAPAMVADMAAPVAPVMAAPVMAAPVMAAPVMAAPVMAPDAPMAAPVVAPMDPVPAQAPEASDEPAPVESLPADAAVADATAPTAMAAATDAPAKPAAKADPSAKTDPWWKSLLGGLLSILLVFVSALATGLGALLIKWIAKKMKVTDAESIAVVDKLYDSAVELGINYAEQQARKLSDNPDSKGQRLVWATEKVKAAIKDMGLAEKATDWITTRIEAKLGVMNAGKPASAPTEPPKAADTAK